jgi:hypothetical protein
MRALRIIAVSFILTAVLEISVGISSVRASDYLGEICLSVHKTQDENGPTNETYVMRLGVTNMGGPSYIVQGIIQVPDDNPVISEGTAVVIGSDVFITMNSCQEHSSDPWRDTAISQVHLSLSTLSGTVWSNRLDYNTSTHQFDHGYAAGTVAITTCP